MPEKKEWCVREFAKMLSLIHSTVVPDEKLPDMKSTVTGWVEFMKDYLPQKYWNKLSKMVAAVPDDNHMIHGDYHIKNLVLQGDEVLLIDMDTLAVGNPVFELGSIYNAFAGFSEYDHDQVKKFLGIDRATSIDFWHRTLAAYLGTSDPQKIKEVEDKARIIGYVRLIRRSIRRNGLENETEKKKIALWNDHLLELLDNVDSLLFNRNELQINAKEKYLPDVLSFLNSLLLHYSLLHHLNLISYLSLRYSLQMRCQG